MSMTMGTKKGLRSDINITPYIDILLVLLIIFMVVTPVHQRELKVRVPGPPQPIPPIVQYRSDAIVVSVGDHAEIAINRIPTDIGHLGVRLREIYSTRYDKSLFISASSGLPYGDVVKVIDISKGAGIVNVGLLSEEMH
jgi:biopolymer transport protein TolR